MKKLFVIVGALALMISCTNKKSNETTQSADTTTVEQQVIVPAAPVEVINVSQSLKGDATDKHALSVTEDGAYVFNLVSENTGAIFVIQDSNGNNVIDETNPSWEGNLPKGEYTVIVGLTRNAARKAGAKMDYTLKVERK